MLGRLQMVVVVAACGSSVSSPVRAPAPNTQGAAAPPVSATPPPAPPAPVPHARVPEPTIATAGGERCELATAIRIGVTPRPRVAAVAFQIDGGLAAWLGGPDAADLMLQLLTADGHPTGTPKKVALAGPAVLEALATADGHYVVLLRTPGSNQNLGSNRQTRTWLYLFDHDATLLAERTIGENRLRESVYLRYRDGALRVLVEESYGRNSSTLSAAIKPPSLDFKLETTDGFPYYQGGYLKGDQDLSASISTVGPDHIYQFQRIRVPFEKVGAPIDLPVKELDFYAEEGGEIILENLAQKPRPRWAWNGKRYFISTVQREAKGYATQLLPMDCR